MQDFHVSNYDRKLKRTYDKAKESLSSENFSLVSKYDSEMVQASKDSIKSLELKLNTKYMS